MSGCRSQHRTLRFTWLRRIAVVCFWLCLIVSLQTRVASAAEASNREVFQRGVAALEQGKSRQAVAEFELLADRGFVHPDVSFNRGIAYLLRADTSEARPGDLGRAAAALRESLLLRSGNADAQAALEYTLKEIGRRRARQQAAPLLASPSLDRAIVGLLPEYAWALIAAFGSGLLTVGYLLRVLSKRDNARLSGAVAAGVGLLCLVLGGSLLFAARHFRLTTQPATVVVSEARLLNAQGVPISHQGRGPDQTAIPEGAEVYVLERKGPLARVEWGTTEAWVSQNQLRLLARPEP